jgi:iron complex outermembrane receptor protein
MKNLLFSSSVIALTLCAGGAWAQTDSTNEVIVTGTRTSGLKAVDSAAPVQVLDAGSLKRAGQPDLMESLAQNVPSFTAQAIGGDAANLTLSARLRGLSPNDTLVLVDGKRRHGTGSLAVLGGPYQGAAAADLNFIPVSAIDHVEVLTDGAAAQYGTDAIAGVINIILKKNTSGGSISATGGQYMDGGGDTGDISANLGIAPIDHSYFNVTVESRFHGHSDRGNPDPRLYNHPDLDGNTVNNVGPGGPYAEGLDFPGAPNANHISGDAMYHLNILSYTAGYDFDNGLSIYNNGTYGHKNGQAFENYRTPDKAPLLWPTGFNPKEELQEDDFQETIGVKDKLYGWNIDLSTTYGKDLDDFSTEGTANNALAASPANGGEALRQTDFYDGKFIAGQWTSNLDVSRDFNTGFLASPLTVASGVEYRKDYYEVGAGEPNSYNGSGAASFPGLTPQDSGHYSRENVGVYVDLAASPIDKLKVDVAGRFEHFSDFGDTTVFKVTGRYDFTPQYALRGTISSGFRAPTLAEEYYTNVNVGPHTAFAQIAPNSASAAALGVDGLKPEQSNNYSVGLVMHPIPKLTVTVDAYDIIIKDRIVSSGDIYGTGNPAGFNSSAVNNALTSFVGAAALAGDDQTGVNLFANGLSTRTEGVEFVATYSESYGDLGHVDWSVSGAYNDTKVTKINPSSSTYAPQTLYDAPALSYLTDASPKVKIIFGALWTYQLFTVNAHETVYGPSSEIEEGDEAINQSSVYYKNKIDTTAITDLDIAYQFRPDIKFSVGATDLFNQYPNKLNPNLVKSFIVDNDNSAVSKYPDFSPFGINGGYYYGKVTFTF